MTRPRPRRNPLAYRSDIEALEGRRMLAASIVEAPLDAVRGILVNTTLDEPAADPGSQDPTTADGKISLRSAIQAANATGGLVGIDLPAGIYILTIPPTGADDAASGDLNITTGLLNISGAGAATTIIDAGGIDRALTVQAGTGRLGISGVTIANGSAPMVNGLATGGGAVRLDSGSLTLTSCDIIDSTSTGPGGGAGAGIYVAPAAQLTLDTCLVSNNVASGPGGTATGGGLFVAGGGRATLVNDNINGNAAAGSGASNSDGEGGGLYNDGGQVALTGTSIGENKASADADGVVSRGGGIFETGGGTLTLTNSTLDGNSAQGAVPTDGEAGGDLYNDGDVVTLTNSTVSLGSVSFSPDAPQEETASLAPAIAPSGGVGASLGAGIFNSGVLALTNTIISDNLASYYLGGQGAGGGIYNTGQVSWDGGTADGNFAVSGAGIANIGGTMTLAGVTISGNSADFALVQGPEDHHGIGIDNEGVLTLTKSTVRDNHAVSNMNAVGANGGTSTGGGIYNSGQATLDDDTISGNSANRGGGLAVDGGRLDMLDSTISDNAGGIGGGLYFGPPDIIPIPAPAGALDGAGITGSTITGSTIAFNSSDGTSGNDLVFSDVPLPLTLENTILAGNVGDQNYSTLGGFNSIVSAGHNLNSDASSAFEFRAPGDLSNVDPKLGPLQDNGGPTFTRAPLPGSPAIDAGDPANAPATDQRGQPRIQGNGIDIGAVESSGTAATPPMISVFPSITAAPSPATVGQAVIYVVTATNNSDAPATGVVLNFDLPAGATSVPSLGSPTPVGRRLTFSLGTLPARGSASETIVVTPSAPGTLFVDAFATATNQTVVDDPLPFATVVNAATTTTQAADLAVALAPPTGPIVVGVSTRFTVTVTNTGPSPATGVTPLRLRAGGLLPLLGRGRDVDEILPELLPGQPGRRRLQDGHDQPDRR